MSVRSAMSRVGTSVPAYNAIDAGEGSWLTFWSAALPLRKIRSLFNGTYSHGTW